MKLRNSNPVFKGIDYDTFGSTSATYGGIIIKTASLFMLLVLSILGVMSNPGFFAANVWILFVAMIFGFVMVMIGSRNPNAAKVTGPLYAIAEGLVLGILISFYEVVAPGLVQVAVMITLSIFFMLLVLYSLGIIRVGSFFKRVVTGAMMGLLFFMFIAIIIGLFSPTFSSNFYGNLNLMLLVSLISAGIASAMILIDLDNCTTIVQNNLDKEYEWTASLGLMVTIIWLFIEILRILLIFASRRD